MKKGETHQVFILRKVNLMFIKKVMDMRKKGNDIRFHMLLNHRKAFELGMSITICNTAMYKLAQGSYDPRVYV